MTDLATDRVHTGLSGHPAQHGGHPVQHGGHPVQHGGHPVQHGGVLGSNR